MKDIDLGPTGQAPLATNDAALLLHRATIELAALKAAAHCNHCGARGIRAVIDGDALCQSCCDEWARSQRNED